MAVAPISAQSVSNEGEAWAGYISSIRLGERFSLWNDFHFVTSSFFATRHGVTYSLSDKIDLTAGYAWVVTSTSFSNQLIRPEHRPWGQAVLRTPLSARVNYQGRVRYDARFRKQVANGQVLDSRVLVHRIRLMNGFRFRLKELSNNRVLHLNLMDEILFNAGKNSTGILDQNRFYLLVGMTKGGVTVQGGYHWRAIPGAAGHFTFKHGVTVWCIHNMDFRKGR